MNDYTYFSERKEFKLTTDKKIILFIVRIDASIKGGGDLVQAQEYKTAIESSLHNFEVFFYHELSKNDLISQKWDCVHIFNISRLHENIAAIQNLTYSTLVICPIFQPGFDFRFKSLVTYFFKSILLKKKPSLITKNKINQILESAHGFIFLSTDEREAFFDKFKALAHKDFAIFENGTNLKYSTDVRFDLIDFLCIGRIEPKKRTNETIDLVSKLLPGSFLVCAGSLNWYHPVYCFRFLLKVFTGKAVYMGKVPQTRVHQLMLCSKTLLNLSELEVSPLVDLEALACNCNVISTIYSYTHLQQGSNFKRVDVRDIDACRVAVTTPFELKEENRITSSSWIENSTGYLKLLHYILETRNIKHHTNPTNDN